LSAKATPEELSAVPHHMIDICEPTEMGFNVSQFQKRATAIIQELYKQGKQPIVTGGTLYYLSSVAFPSLFQFMNNEQPKESAELDKLEPAELYARLEKVDPERASLLHPNATRKVLRSLQYFEEFGMKHSDWINQLQSRYGICFVPRSSQPARL